MNRSTRESPMRVRKTSMAVQSLQGRPVNDESLEFFSWLKKCPAETKAGQLGGVQGKRKSKVNGKVETNDLLSTDIGKNEYDWLLNPTEARTVPSHPIHPKTSPLAKDNPKVRSVSATRPSRLSQETSNSPSNSNPRLARSSSVARSSIISNPTTRSSLSHSIARASSISNNSMTRSSIVSNNSTTRPSSSKTITTSSTNKSPQNPTKSQSPASKVTSPLTRPVSARLSSPLKTRNPKPSPSSSPSTPKTAVTTTTTTPRQPTPTRRATSSIRQPTPTRSATSSVPAVSRSSSLTRLPDTKNIKIPKPSERSVSAVRQRLIGASASMSLNRRPATSPVSSPKRNMTRSQFGESLGKSRLSGLSESRKPIRPAESTSRKLIKPVPAIDKTALSRTGSRKSLDPNAKITDKSIGGSKRAPLYPRSNSNRLSKSRLDHSASRSDLKVVPTDDTSHGTSSDRAGSDDGSVRLVKSETTFESSRYDAILLKEDVHNLSWLHSEDDSVLQSPLFHRFDPPPEPFDI